MVKKTKAKLTADKEPTYGSEHKPKELKIELQQGRLLFVCDNATNRSPAFAEYYNEKYQNKYLAKFAGIKAYDEKHQLDEHGLFWADAIFCMDLEQVIFIRKHYPEFAGKVWLCAVSDNYEYPSKALSTIIVFWDNYMFGTYHQLRLNEAARKYAEDNKSFTVDVGEVQSPVNVSLNDEVQNEQDN